ncbi:hypothetical protein FHG87_017622 [Trinorchestia longiramus]|nr:hypothetical protein FHG87_017622 [Trinorchestia longiramus]
MLPHEQPDILDMVIYPRDLRKTRWAEIIQQRKGPLQLWMLDQEPCDDLLAPLRNSNGREGPTGPKGPTGATEST